MYPLSHPPEEFLAFLPNRRPRKHFFYRAGELRRRRRHLAGRKVRRPRGAAFLLSLSLLVINYMRQNGEDGRKQVSSALARRQAGGLAIAILGIVAPRVRYTRRAARVRSLIFGIRKRSSR